MAAVISVERLSKRYSLGQGREGPYRTLRDELARWASSPLRWATRPKPAPDEEFWALRDVSFEVQTGEVVGIIGSNGAGKSTLLKVLSRITEPTEGRIEISGRVASLLEVGTGFHPELTGRENIFLNGAILGMTRAEIRKKFDEIVAFAEVERFLDTPVKRYSSGMYVRLAFAVAAHLEPEVLVIDEVLAVGDHQFQQKCLGKMQDVSRKDGRTVLFVSHQMGTVRQLCSRAILLRAGRVAEMGPTNKVVEAYLGSRSNLFRANASTLAKDLAVESALTFNRDDEAVASFIHTDEITVRVACRINRWVPGSELRMVLEDSRGRRIFTADLPLRPPLDTQQGTLAARIVIPKSFLRPDTYLASFVIFVHNQVIIDHAPDAISFVVSDGGTKYAASEGVDYGCVFPPCEWSLEASDHLMTGSSAAKG
jgi:lipopolysaccharide transport system ATP-binding protein